MEFFVGIDWADQKHDITVVDHQGNRVTQNLIIKNRQDGFEKLLDRLRAISPASEDLKIGIETPHHLLVDFLMDAGYSIFSIFPGSMKSFRRRYRSSGARDDQFDSFVLADVLRTDSKCWQRVDYGSETIRKIRLLIRDLLKLTHAKNQWSNSLITTLKLYYPEYRYFFSNATCKTSLAFLMAYPDFESAQALSLPQLEAFFKEQHFRNSKTIKRIHDLLHQKHIPVPAVLVQTQECKMTLCARILSEIDPAIESYMNRLTALVDKHPDGEIFLSYPGASYLTAARLLALFGDDRQRFQHDSEVQALAGTCPVTEKTGTHHTTVIYYRRACNKFYRTVMHDLAFCSLTRAKWAKKYYDDHRQRGHKNAHALRCLANVHLKILFSMWKKRTYYDENHYLAQKTRHTMNLA